ncbi:carbonic anhydrase [Xylariales sp. PMI_506]|nr:carbonic anhydrase [Xylariales sp. PMI_506]
MGRSLIIAALFFSATIIACPEHNPPISVNTKRAEAGSDWAYAESFDWGSIDEAYAACQSGTQQSPIALTQNYGLSNSKIGFNYPTTLSGNFSNWSYGPSFTVAADASGSYSQNPSFTFGNQTVYFKGWHIHAPGEHIVDGVRTRAEMHFVHGDSTGHEKAVLAFRINPSNISNEFFTQMPALVGFNETEVTEPAVMNLNLAVKSVKNFAAFWTYQGSLTSPPCTEGIQWFVSKDPMNISTEQMQALLSVSKYSARVEQPIWQHALNQI